MSDQDRESKTRNSRRWGRWLLCGSLFVVLVVVGLTVLQMIPVTRRYYTDADAIRIPTKMARTRDILWQPPRKLAEIVNTTSDDYEPKISADGLTLLFVRGKAGENADIYFAKRTPSGWSEPSPLPEVNTEFEDLGPEPSADGESLYFYSDRPGGCGGYDIWMTHRGRDGWTAPVNLGPLVNSEYNDYGPALTPDGETLYFSSNRPQPTDVEETDTNAWSATIREDLFQRDYDLYRSAVTDAGFARAKVVSPLNTPHNEGAPSVSSFGDFVYFASDRPGGHGAFDLYRSRIVHGLTQPVENLGPVINTAANELDPGLGLGGYGLYFASDRSGGRMAAEGPVPYDLYYTTSREVFTQIESLRRPPLNWAAIWRRVGPNLLWALLALLLLLLMLALFHDARGRRLSLLAKCLLASLTAHLLLMLLFNAWEVTASIAHEFRRRGPIRIALASPSAADGLARQIRGDLTKVDAPAPPQIEMERRPAPVPLLEAPADACRVCGPDLLLARVEVNRLIHYPPESTTALLNVRDAFVENRPAEMVSIEAMSDTAEPMSLDMDIPEEHPVGRVRRPDTDAAPRVPYADSDPLDRPDVQPAVDPPPETAVDMTDILPAIDAIDAVGRVRRPDTSLATGFSMAHLRSAQEALPHSLTASRTNAASRINASIPSLDAPAKSDLSLPLAPVQRQAEQTETNPRILVPATQTLRFELATGPLLPTQAGPEFDIEPGSAVSTLEELMFSVDASEHATEVAALPFAAGDLPAESAAAQALPARSVLKLSWLEAAPVDGATESVPAPVAPRVTRLRQALDVEAATDPDRDVLVAVQPQRNESVGRVRRPDTSLVSPTEVRDVTLPATMASAAAPSPTEPQAPARGPRPVALTLTTLKTDLPLPNLQDLALPQMEDPVGRVRRPDTRPPRPARLLQVVPRAELDDPMVSSMNSFTVPSDDVPLSWQRDESETRRSGPQTRHARDDSETPGELSQLPIAALDAQADETVALALATPELTLKPLELPSLDLPLPTEVAPLEDPYAQRRVPDKLGVVKRMGGSEETERAVAEALAWLARHQSEDGHWDGDAFDAGCGQCGGETETLVDRALTGLALLSFLGAGHTHTTDGPYRHTVEQALQWILEGQAPDGDLRGDETMYTQGILTIALSEAFGMTGDTSLSEPARRAALFIDRGRNNSVGGWRYDPGQAGDTSVMGWQVMAVKSASLGGIGVPASSFKTARQWLDRVSSRSRPGRYAYQRGRQFTPAMTAEGMFSQQLLGLGREDPRMKNAARFIMENLPDWNADANTYYWYYATLAMFQHQGSEWNKWNQALTKELLSHQRRAGPAKGSWDPDGEWADVGGRVYQTALCTLILEVYYRYLPLYSLDGPTDPIGAIRGYVTDSATGEALHDATVRLVLPDRPPVTVKTGPDGGFVLAAPEVPEFFALSASRHGYVPESANVSSATVVGTTLTLDFQLDPISGEVVAIEAVPDVHHLGDNDFSGSINSRFQKESEGAIYTAKFEVTELQLPPYVRHGEVKLLAKGVQRSHKVVINGVVLDRRLDDAPEDGSFGEFTASFDPALLRDGTNMFEIIAKPSRSDIDDFEFVNVQIHLSP